VACARQLAKHVKPLPLRGPIGIDTATSAHSLDLALPDKISAGSGHSAAAEYRRMTGLMRMVLAAGQT
jgi:hypothetical protein